jgi:hypothetical protein
VSTVKDLLNGITTPCLFVGPGAAVYRELIAETLGRGAILPETALNAIRAETVGRIAMGKIQSGDWQRGGSLKPCYLRKSDAEINAAGKKEMSDDVDTSSAVD